MNKGMKVSIILPVYNVEKYLRECMESAVNQTLDSVELIAVNDGSTDNSLNILEEYREKYNIKIINQENKGLSEARNSGLRIASGEYVYFLDSDDYIDLEAMEYCYNKCKENDLDIINFDAISFQDENDKEAKLDIEEEYDRGHILNSDVYKGEDFYNYLISNNAYRQPVWLSMYKTSFLKENNLDFYPGLIHEDELFTKIAYLQSSRIIYVPKQFFHRRVRSNSIMTSKMSRKKVESIVIIAENIYNYYYKNKNNLKDETINNIIKYCDSLYSIALRRSDKFDGTNSEKKELRKEIINSIKARQDIYSTRLKIQVSLPKLYELVYEAKQKIKR